jgi:NAD(P)-dependent dehydrogenase (short-subunit alcohol dehydrogenase family)
MRTWFITGVSSGFGRALSELLLKRGERVVGTLRTEVQKAAFESTCPGRSIGVVLDVTHTDAIIPTVEKIEQGGPDRRAGQQRRIRL